jgi:hypothetical protein
MGARVLLKVVVSLIALFGLGIPKRALARGDYPEEVIRRIADYRADDKPNPKCCARLTAHNLPGIVAY